MVAARALAPLRGIAAAAVWSLCGMAAVAQNAAPPVESVDVYGSHSFDSAKLRAEYESEILRFAALGIEAQTNPNADMPRLEAEADAIQAKVRTPHSARKGRLRTSSSR